MSGAEYLIFGIGKESYGIDILCVREIRTFTEPTRMALAPDWFLGVIDIRGTIIPIIDTRIKFNLQNPIYDETTIVIVVSKGDSDFGLVVDKVEEVCTFSKEEMQDPPSMESDVLSAASVKAIANKQDSPVVMLLDSTAFISDIQRR